MTSATVGAMALVGGAKVAESGRLRSGAGGRARKPNILFIVADDLGYADVSCYGRRDYRTPAIDRLAAEGLRFLQGYANSSVCSATRAALITGRYQYRLPLGLEEPLDERDVGLPPSHPTLPSILRRQGYCTTLIGKWHLGALPNYSPLKSGYDHFWGFRTGGVDYFTHKYFGKPDLWDGDVPIERNGRRLWGRCPRKWTAAAKENIVLQSVASRHGEECATRDIGNVLYRTHG